METIRKIEISPVARIGDFLRDGNLVAFNRGYDGLLYFVFALRPLNYRTEQAHGIFAVTQPAQPQRYRVVALDEWHVALDMVTEDEPFNIHLVAPLPEGILLACGRSHYRSADDFERNGRVYALDGKLERDFLLGDGIQDLQTTAEGTIWTSFFDEGIFGNYGWNQPVGGSGLVAWNNTGEKIYEFAPHGSLGSMCDCYALNVPSGDNVWCYYYTEFPLVKIQQRKIVASWNVPVAGADAFAVEKQYALFRGGYHERDVYRLFRLAENAAVEERRIEIVIEDNTRLIAERAVGQGAMISLLHGENVYNFDVGMALS